MIIYRIFFSTIGEEENMPFSKQNAKKTSVAQKDTFELLLNYPDPFLKNEKRGIINNRDINQQSAPAAKKITEPKPTKEVETINWPALKYEGLVKHIKEGHELAIVNINGSSKLMKVGETVENIKLIKACSDSITVCCNKQNKTIKKN